MGEQSQKKHDRKFTVLKLPDPERDLIRLLGTGDSEKEKGWFDRDTVLRHVAEYVEKLELPTPPPAQKKSSLRVSICDELDNLLKKRSKESGLPQQTILVEAVRQFRQDFPLEHPPKSGEEDTPPALPVE
jgi:hypothetical protein